MYFKVNTVMNLFFIKQFDFQSLEGAVSYYDFTYNNNIYKIVWHQLPQAEGDPFCSRHLGHNASLWRVQDQAALESVGDELTKRVRGTGLQFWVAGDPTNNNTFTYWGKATVRQGMLSQSIQQCVKVVSHQKPRSTAITTAKVGF